MEFGKNKGGDLTPDMEATLQAVCWADCESVVHEANYLHSPGRRWRRWRRGLSLSVSASHTAAETLKTPHPHTASSSPTVDVMHSVDTETRRRIVRLVSKRRPRNIVLRSHETTCAGSSPGALAECRNPITHLALVWSRSGCCVVSLFSNHCSRYNGSHENSEERILAQLMQCRVLGW